MLFAFVLLHLVGLTLLRLLGRHALLERLLALGQMVRQVVVAVNARLGHEGKVVVLLGVALSQVLLQLPLFVHHVSCPVLLLGVVDVIVGLSKWDGSKRVVWVLWSSAVRATASTHIILVVLNGVRVLLSSNNEMGLILGIFETAIWCWARPGLPLLSLSI